MAQENKSLSNGRIKDLQRQIDELKQSWPAHSVPAVMLQRLEELEDELEKLLQQDTNRDAQADRGD